MVSILGAVIIFFVGAVVGRYFEKIISFLEYVREDLINAREQASKGIPQK